ncbi:hypothetical protein RBB80_16315 [Tunturiibacter gelidiferens]
MQPAKLSGLVRRSCRQRSRSEHQLKDYSGGILPPGALKSDIIIRVSEDGDGVLQAKIGPDKETAWIANLVEYGHRGVQGGKSRLYADGKTKGPGKQTHDVPEHPFIRPAWEAVSQEVTNTICTTLIAEVEAAAARKGNS